MEKWWNDDGYGATSIHSIIQLHTSGIIYARNEEFSPQNLHHGFETITQYNAYDMVALCIPFMRDYDPH